MKEGRKHDLIRKSCNIRADLLHCRCSNDSSNQSWLAAAESTKEGISGKVASQPVQP